jgi:hypothetical protein
MKFCFHRNDNMYKIIWYLIGNILNFKLSFDLNKNKSNLINSYIFSTVNELIDDNEFEQLLKNEAKQL